MLLDNNIEIGVSAISNNLKRLISQTYKLLPNREENLDWQTPLTTIIEELGGMTKLLGNYQEKLFSLICKLEGLFDLTEEGDFFLYRRTIFECLNLIQDIKKVIEETEE
jgi:hypothetical protein